MPDELASSQALRRTMRDRRFRASLVTLLVVAGVCISAALGWVLHAHERELIRARFSLDAQRRADAVEHAFREQLRVAQVTGAFYASSQVVERGEFQTFAATLLSDYPQLDWLAWAPRIERAASALHEAAARAEGIRDYAVRQPPRAPHAADPAAPQFPMYFFAGRDPHADALGIDVGAVPALRGLIAKALETRRIAAGVAPPVLGPESSALGWYTVSPIEGHDAGPAAPPGERQTHDLLGVVLCRFSLETSIAQALQYLEPTGIDVSVFETAADRRPQLLFTQPSTLRSALDRPAPQTLQQALADGLAHVKTFDAGGQGWVVLCTALSSYGGHSSGWTPIGVALAGTLLTFFAAGYFSLLLKHMARSEALATQRSIELQTISDSALDAVIMMDPAGRIAHWNPAAERTFGYSAHDILGRAVHETLVPAWLKERAVTGVQKFFADGRGPMIGRVLELTGLHRDGHEFPVELSISPIPLRGEWWAIAIIRDITRRRRDEEAIAEERRALRRMLNVQERDRKLLAHEIHDGLAQDLVGALFQLQAAAESPSHGASPAALLGQAKDLIANALAEARRVIAGLRPPILDELGVVAAIEYLAAPPSDGGGPKVDFVNRYGAQRLASTIEIAVFRIIQEALTNARRYSRSERIALELTQESDRLRVTVEDWGIGFEPGKVPPTHYGLAGIRERARLLGGSAEIVSSPGNGTKITVELPLIAADDIAAEKDAAHEAGE